MSEPFVEPVAIENAEAGCFPGDRGVLDAEVRRVLVQLLRRRFLDSERNPADWAVLMEHQQIIESRLHDVFLNLVVDTARGVAYKQQVTDGESEIPVLLRDTPYNDVETLVLLYLRTIYQRESTAGEPFARVDVEEVEQNVLTYFAEIDGDVAARQSKIHKALETLRKEGVVTEESSGRFRIRPLVEIVLSADKLRELTDWLAQGASVHGTNVQGTSGTGASAKEPGAQGSITRDTNEPEAEEL